MKLSLKRLPTILSGLLFAALLLPACAPKTVDCVTPEVFCVGLVTEVGKLDDHGFNQAAWDGIQQARNAGVADRIASIETVDYRDYEENIRVFGDAGYDAIVTIGSGMGTVTRAASRSYPDTYFIGVDQDQSTSQDFSPNMTGLVFAEDQIGFLAGAMAAMMSESRQVGAVGASDVLPSIQRYGSGFISGVAYVDPSVKATITYHNDVDPAASFDDPDWGAATANLLVDSGADIIFGVGGDTGSNALVAAVTRGAYAVGADTDQYYALPVAAPHLYISVLKLITPAVADLLKMARDAQAGSSVFPSGNYAGQVGLSPYHDLASTVPEDVKLRMDEMNRALLSGEIQTGVSPINP